MGKHKLFALFLIVFTVMLSSFVFYGYQLIYTPNVHVDGQQNITLTIEKGMTFKELQNRLDDGRVVNNLVAFSFVAKLMGYHKNVQPGHYTITPNMTNVHLVRYLKAGNPTVMVSFHTARRLGDLSSQFAEFIFPDSSDLSRYFAQEEVQSSFGFNSQNMISLFLPDTYEFYYRTSPEQLLTRMNKEYDKFWTDERKQKAENIGLTQKEVSTLASIVRGETAQLDEASRIAGVYKNRLDIGMRLQADPTLIFAQENFTIRRVRKGDREIDSPYNTYKYKGLPPGPINMPSKAYIDAVLNVEDHDYLYFCADASFNGYHVFAKNYDNHLKNARKLWRALNRRDIER